MATSLKLLRPSVTEGGEIRVSTEAEGMAFLEHLGGQVVHACTISGPARTGKSLLASCLAGTNSNVFRVMSSMAPCTKGVDIAPSVVTLQGPTEPKVTPNCSWLATSLLAHLHVIITTTSTIVSSSVVVVGFSSIGVEP